MSARKAFQNNICSGVTSELLGKFPFITISTDFNMMSPKENYGFRHQKVAVVSLRSAHLFTGSELG
jgi:hypothetical protein